MTRGGPTQRPRAGGPTSQRAWYLVSKSKHPWSRLMRSRRAISVVPHGDGELGVSITSLWRRRLRRFGGHKRRL